MGAEIFRKRWQKGESIIRAIKQRKWMEGQGLGELITVERTLKKPDKGDKPSFF